MPSRKCRVNFTCRHMSVSIFWPQPPKHFCFIIYKSAIVLNECKVTHCSGAFLLFHDYTASTHRRRRKGTEVENPQKKVSNNKLQIMIRSLTLQPKLLNLPLITAAAFRGTFLSYTDSVMVALQVIVYCRIILWCHSYCGHGVVIPTSLHLKLSTHWTHFLRRRHTRQRESKYQEFHFLVK